MGRFLKNRRGSGESTILRRSAFLLVVLSGIVSLAACEFRRHETRGTGEAEGQGSARLTVIPDMLRASAASWNAGDLDGFMDDYWRSPDITFSGATGVTRGWENVKDRYLQSHWAPGAVRDSLRFEDIEVYPLGEAHAIALGRYVLFQPEEPLAPASSGFFTLVLRMTDGGWRIVHDHTSATPDENDPGGGWRLANSGLPRDRAPSSDPDRLPAPCAPRRGSAS